MLYLFYFLSDKTIVIVHLYSLLLISYNIHQNMLNIIFILKIETNCTINSNIQLLPQINDIALFINRSLNDEEKLLVSY